jgi:hypothetical protein
MVGFDANGFAEHLVSQAAQQQTRQQSIKVALVGENALRLAQRCHPAELSRQVG